jgi:hypothetical protein
MTAALWASSVLRLPAGTAETSSTLPADGLRGRLEELARRKFSGRVELQCAHSTAELLLSDGEPVAAALGENGSDRPLAGQPALNALLAKAEVAWTCCLETVEPVLLSALTGLGASARLHLVACSEDLRKLLRQLASSGDTGILELASERHWSRALLAEGRVLGSYSDSNPELEPSLVPLGELLSGPRPRVQWLSAANSAVLEIPPPVADDEPENADLEQRVIWILSRFEGAWGRARERGAPVQELQEALFEMLESLRGLADEQADEQRQSAANGAAMADKDNGDRLEPVDSLRQRLARIDPAAGCGELVELVVAALDRLAHGSTQPHLVTCCRLAAMTLNAELRAAFRPEAIGAGLRGAEAR